MYKPCSDITWNALPVNIMKIEVFKSPVNTKFIRKNQKCWIMHSSGDCAYRIICKYRGKGRYINIWYNYKWALPEPKVFTIDITENFYRKLRSLYKPK